VCAGPGKQVNFNETPRAAELERRQPACRGERAQRDGVQAKGRCGLGDSQQSLTHVFPLNTINPALQLKPVRLPPEDVLDHSDATS
jgi:hypothetical protein